MVQITKKNRLIPFALAVFFQIIACGNSQTQADSQRSWCLKKTDSLWGILNQTRKNFNYQMDEIAERREDMDSVLKILKFHGSNEFKEEERSNVIQYASVLSVYKTIANGYKEAVLKSEDHFYRLKALERSVKNGEYDSKLDDFKKTYAELKTETEENMQRTGAIASKLTAMEPMYLRLQPKIEDLLDRVTK